eukprot:7181046-Prorocentrum_lima.AAC.1
MQPLHRRTICTALGLPADAERTRVMAVNSSRWSPFPRRRLLFSTLPVPTDPWYPHHRGECWEPGWG